MERHVDARDQDERALATELGDLTLDHGLEGFEAGDRTGDRVLRSAQVEVDDLQELPGLLGDTGDEGLQVRIVHTELRRPDRGHAVVRAAVLVARHEGVHRGAALEDHLEDGLERQHTGDRGERVVLTHRVTGQEGVVDERARLLELGDLRDTEGRHRDLRELGQVQHAVGVLVGDTASLENRRVVADHGQDREAERLAGVLVGALPDLAGGLRAARASRPMPGRWMPWPGKA